MSSKLTFKAVVASQGTAQSVFTFAAKGAEILQFAAIDRAGRNAKGKLEGFQRLQSTPHIKEIGDYLTQAEAILPNSIVVGFTRGIEVEKTGTGTAIVTIDCAEGPMGWIVDGQQRLSALWNIDRDDFEVFVSAFICRTNEDLRQQFVLINNTKPLPRSLIYELLPTVSGLPPRLAKQSKAAALVERLNFDPSSSLYRQIYMHTNPSGVVKDTALQKIILNSTSDGAIREFKQLDAADDRAFDLINNYFRAVQQAFDDEWEGHSPRTSRLVHGAGIVAMGYVMELLYARDLAFETAEFLAGLTCLMGHTAWTVGSWRFSDKDLRPWNDIQNTSREVRKLTDYLLRIVRNDRSIHLRRLKIRNA